MNKSLPAHDRGFAVWTLLFVIALLATLGVAMASSLVRDDGRAQRVGLRGQTAGLLSQGTYLLTLAAMATTSGSRSERLTWDNSKSTSLFQITSTVPVIPSESLETSLAIAGWAEASITVLDIPGIGTEMPDEVFVAYGLNQALCEAVNRRLYDDATAYSLGPKYPSGRLSGCFQSSSPSVASYDYYTVYRVR